jgi:hypothetical protein
LGYLKLVRRISELLLRVMLGLVARYFFSGIDQFVLLSKRMRWMRLIGHPKEIEAIN